MLVEEIHDRNSQNEGELVEPRSVYSVTRYHSLGWRTVDSHWTHSCRCRRGSAGWTSWFGGDASATACTWPSPSSRLSTAHSQRGCRWWSLWEGRREGVAPESRLALREKKKSSGVLIHSPTTCGSVVASRSSMMVPFSMHILSSIKLCNDSVATWGLLQRSPPFSTFSSNLIHLEIIEAFDLLVLCFHSSRLPPEWSDTIFRN